ncbi:MAG: sn-glycerol-1-phosphate dehydrogenase [Clostridia bacterium]|nr:sn-glycerol-1-phosphate dehydrogenase [Clostridia bacterium]
MKESKKIVLPETGCICGKDHRSTVDEVIVGSGVVARLPEVLARYGAKKVFVLADKNTYKAAGERVCAILGDSGIEHTLYVMHKETIEPNEEAVGSVVMHFDNSCDMMVVVGTGVLNDVTKIVSTIRGKRYVIVATAPSMDGFASNSASVIRDKFKLSIDTCTASVIIGDTQILAAAPMRMLLSGIGDMIAKYISILEWKLANIICGDYYCEGVAEMIRQALRECVENAEGLVKRDEAAVAAVFKGLVLSGEAMMYAGVTRPASGTEHYFSHIWDMRGLDFGTPVDFHGIQCAVGTYQSMKVYEQLKKVHPDRDKALNYVKNFDVSAWQKQLRGYIGTGADMMIKIEEKEQKYSIEKHAERLEILLAKWDEIIGIINEELPTSEALDNLFNILGMPKDPSDIGQKDEDAKTVFLAVKDVRDKYVSTRLAWDLGILDEIEL